MPKAWCSYPPHSKHEKRESDLKELVEMMIGI